MNNQYGFTKDENIHIEGGDIIKWRLLQKVQMPKTIIETIKNDDISINYVFISK